MLSITEKDKCCGCGACMAVCPQGCIAMNQDGEGFLYPQIDTKRCVDCGLCGNTCPVLRKPPFLAVQKTYSAYNRDEAVRRQSSSGGVFTALAQYILSQGGAVFGAAFDADFQVRHICVEKPEELYKLRSSKYMQSRTDGTYRRALDILKENRPVLYTGTPCQIAGLRAFLKKDYEKLFTQSIICHGVPSPKIWDKYLAFVNKGEEVRAVEFRNKDDGWKKYRLKIEKNGGGYRATAREDPYLQAFIKNLSLRPSCGACVFKSYEQPADITLADYWGVEQLEPELDDDKGLSLLFIHSQKGRQLFEHVQESLVFRPADAQKAVAYNQSLLKASVPHKKRAYFFANVDSIPFDKLVEKCLRLSTAEKLGQKIRYNMRRIKNRLKRIKK